MTTTITIRLTDHERHLVEEHARAAGTTISEYARTAIMARIEDEVDASELLEAIRRDDGSRYSMDEVARALGVAR